MESISDLQQDLEECKILSQQAQRANTKKILNQEVSRLTNLILTLQSQQVQSIQVTPTQQKAEVAFASITNHAWEQDAKEVKVYVTCLPNLKSSVTKQQVISDFQTNQLDIKILDFDNKNYRFKLKNLGGQIDPKASRITLKSNGFSLTLKKASGGHWSDIVEKKQKKIEPKKTKEQDPGAGLMDMMKQMYQDGDEDMKRTIAEAWTKSRDKQQ